MPEFDLASPADSWQNFPSGMAPYGRHFPRNISFVDTFKIAKLLQLLDSKQVLLDHLQLLNEFVQKHVTKNVCRFFLWLIS